MNGMHFLHKNSSKIDFLTAEIFTSKSAENTIKKFITVKNMYRARGFNIDFFHGDNEFNLNGLREHIRPESLNICEEGQQIPIIEGSIQTIKQGSHFTKNSVTYKR